MATTRQERAELAPRIWGSADTASESLRRAAELNHEQWRLIVDLCRAHWVETESSVAAAILDNLAIAKADF